MNGQTEGVRARIPAAVQQQAVSDISAELLQHIKRRWRTYYPGREPAGEPRITLTPRHFGFSLILQADLEFSNGAGIERFMIKMRRQHKHGSFVPDDLTERILELSRAEYHQHLKAFEFFEGNREGLGVVRPLDFLEAYHAFVVEHAVGDDLSKLVKMESPVAGPALRRCGMWWRRFHQDLQGVQWREWDLDVVAGAVDRRLARVRRSGVPDELVEEIRQEIAATATRVDAVPVPVTFVHGDCKLRHVWATADGIQVIDFGNTKQGDAWMDPAALVVDLSLHSLWSRRLDSAPQAVDIRTLLHAYFEGPPPPAFALAVVDLLLKKWHRRLRNWGSGAGLRQLRRSLATARLDQPLERFYIDRWFTSQIRAWLALADGRAPSWLRPVMD